MYDVIFNSGVTGFLIWVLLFAVSTAVLAIAICCTWPLRKVVSAILRTFVQYYVNFYNLRRIYSALQYQLWMKSISELAIGKQWDIVNQGPLHQSFHKSCPT